MDGMKILFENIKSSYKRKKIFICHHIYWKKKSKSRKGVNLQEITFKLDIRNLGSWKGNTKRL